MSAWPLVPLGEVLVERKERIGSIDADGLPLLGVSNKDGLHRSGMPRISDMSRYLRMQRDWFAYNPMRVNVGSIGWAHSDDLAGVISPDYVVFSCTPKIDPRLLYWFLTSAPGLQAINLQTAGSVRERLYFASLAKVAMPLPPIEEQRRVVERLSSFAQKHRAIQKLRRESIFECETLCRSVLHSAQGCQWIRMSDLVCLRQPDVAVERDKSYAFAGVYCFGKGVFKGRIRAGTEFAYERLTKVHSREFTYPKLMAWEGALGVIPQECDGLYVSPEYPVFTIDTDNVLPEVLDVYYRTPSVWPTLAEASTGTNVRRRRLHPSAFLNLTMPVPPMHVQRQLQQLRSRLDAVMSTSRQIEEEVKALFHGVLNGVFGSSR